MAEAKGIDGYVAIKVQVNEGRTYTVETASALGRDVTEWVKADFAVNDPTAALQRRLSTGSNEVGYRIIYVKKDGPRRFWQLKVE